MRLLSAALGFGLCAAVVPAAAGPADSLPGPLPARVLAVIDGDTVVARVRIWIGQEVETRVRLAGIDAPELHGKCPQERTLAVMARDFLGRRVDGAEVTLRDVHYGKYAGRVVARLAADGVPDLSQALIDRGLARAYDGGARASWCPAASARR